MQLLKKQCDKQKKFIQIQKQKNESLAVDLKHYKHQALLVQKGKQKPSPASVRNSLAKKDAISPPDANEATRLLMNTSLVNLTMDLNDSFIFKESPQRAQTLP